MAGHIALEAPQEKPLWDRFTVEFEDGTRFALRDTAAPGPGGAATRTSPTSARTPRPSTRAEFRKRFGRSGAPVKARLLDQGVISGVGNLLADEALWRARLNPRRPANDLSTRSSTRCGGRSGRRSVTRSARAARTPAA